MRKDIYELPKRIAHIESPYAPRLVGGSVFDPKTRACYPLERRVEIVYLD
jgi:hypothetical protein